MTFTYSSLSTYNTCPKQYEYRYVLKCLPYEQSEAQHYGSEMHSAMEGFIKGTQEMTQRYEFLQPVVEAINRIEGQKEAEYEISFLKDWTPTTFKDKESFVKGKCDLVIFHPEKPIMKLVDYKFSGKAGESEALRYRQELDMYCLLNFKKHEDIQVIDTSLLWLKTKAPTSTRTYTRDMLPELEDKILANIDRVEESLATGEFHCKVSGLCWGWCSANMCPNWKPKKDKK